MEDKVMGTSRSKPQWNVWIPRGLFWEHRPDSSIEEQDVLIRQIRCVSSKDDFRVAYCQVSSFEDPESSSLSLPYSLYLIIPPALSSFHWFFSRVTWDLGLCFVHHGISAYIHGCFFLIFNNQCSASQNRLWLGCLSRVQVERALCLGSSLDFVANLLCDLGSITWPPWVSGFLPIKRENLD